ncbi:hypothetical protein E2562_012434 [Oryza meyeriana var. granulata]|uniref:Uncharacterized protein n=1 Tax=Oryza meyeriana var. granulata TaxID=110450 RepID=A0A6G1C5I6_9ORYZ|nr:hypothetical protein E2562_012434 [Oryza meyeriana var. granulata]
MSWSSHGAPPPCLATEHRTNDQQSTSTAFLSAAENKPVVTAILPLELVDSKVAVFCPTPLGYILVRGKAATSYTYLLDPHHKDRKIQLPPLRGIDDDLLIYCNCLLSDHPTAPIDCIILLV